MTCIAITGKGGGEMSLYAQVNIVVPSNNTQRIQELHLHIVHSLCSLVEEILFSRKARTNKGNVHLAGLNGNGLNGTSATETSLEQEK